MSIKPLTAEQKIKIKADIKEMHIRRYGTKFVFVPDLDRHSHVPKRKSYDMDHLMDDLDFIFNHLTIE